MLFRDQCVAKGTMIPMVETATEVNYQGYKVEVNGSPVTEMRIFRNKTAQQFEIGVDNCLIFSFDIANSLQAIIDASSVLTIGSATINAVLRIYDVIVNKETGAVTESSFGSYQFNNIIDGYYANFAPNQQGGSDPVLLSCNYMQFGTYHIPYGAIGLITTFGTASILVTRNGSTLFSLSASGYTVWKISETSWSNVPDYEVKLTIGSSELNFRVERTSLRDGSNTKINSGSKSTNDDKICEPQKVWGDSNAGETGDVESGANNGSVYFGSKFNNIFFENIRGGLESCACINITNVSSSANRARVILERKTWQPSNVGNPSVSAIDPKSYKFAKHFGRAQGFITKQYEYFTGSIDDLFLNSMATCRRAFLLGGGTTHVDSMIQGYIDGVSASYEEFEDGYKAWRVSFSFTQEIGLEN